MARNKEKYWRLMGYIWRMNSVCLTDLDYGDRERLKNLVKLGKVIEFTREGDQRTMYRLSDYEHRILDRWYSPHIAAHKRWSARTLEG